MEDWDCGRVTGRRVRVEVERLAAFGGQAKEALVMRALEDRVVSPEVDSEEVEEDEEEEAEKEVAIPRLVRPTIGRW